MMWAFLRLFLVLHQVSLTRHLIGDCSPCLSRDLCKKKNKDMVSIRRRKLLAMCSGRNSLLAQLPWVNTPQISSENLKPINVHPLPLNDAYKTKEETAVETDTGSSNGSASSPSKDHALHQFPEMKRRKRHRRKQVENAEACVMRGVYFKNLKWQAAIKVDKKQIHLGTVGSQEEAARLYDRAAFMCGREPNFQLSEPEKQELKKFNWDQFLAITRSAITNKKNGKATSRKEVIKKQPLKKMMDDYT